MKDFGRPFRPAACAAVLAMLLLSGLPLAAADGPRTVTQFPDGSTEATFYFGSAGETNQTAVSISRKAVIGSAKISVEGLPGVDGGYPLAASLRLGHSPVWDFGLTQAGAGEMGRQRTFLGQKDELSFGFPPAGGTARGQGLLLPSAAEVKEASLEISGAPGLLPAAVHSRTSRAEWVFWNTGNGTVVQAAAEGNTVVFTVRDAVTGDSLLLRQVALVNTGGAFVSDIQYLAGSDRAAMLLPGKGVLVVNLTNGLEQEFFTGPDAASLEAMSFFENGLAVLGRGWAAVKDLEGGAEDRFDSAEFPAVPWQEPVGVDFHAESRRLIIACRGASFAYKAVSVFQLDARKVRVFSDSNVTTSLSSMVFLPERDIVLLGLSGAGSVNGRSNNRAVIAMSLADGAVSYLPAFDGLQDCYGLRCQGDLVCAIGGNEGSHEPQLVLLDARDLSWRVFSGAGTAWSSARSWAYHPAAQRLLTSSYASGIEVFELDFALEAGTGWRLPEPRDAVPGRVTAVLARGNEILAGTDNGLTSIGPDGRRNWTFECGRVDALAEDPVTGRLAAAALGGFRYEPGFGLWDLRTVDVLELDLSGPGPVDMGRSVELPKDWFFTSIRGIAPCSLNGSVFLSVSTYYASGLYELAPNGTFVRIQTPSASIGPLALSPDGRTLYAACSGAGLLMLDIATGAQELLTPFSEMPLLSPNVVSIDVDESGGVLVGQAPGSSYFPGGVSLLERTTNGTLETVLSQAFQVARVQSCTRDRVNGRIFVTTGDVLTVINETYGTRTDINPGYYITSIDWSPAGRLLAGSSIGSAIGLGWTDSLPSGIILDIGGDGSADWSGPGPLDGTVLVDITKALSVFLEARQAGQRFTEVPICVSSRSAGLLQLSDLSVVYRFSERVDLQEAIAAYLKGLPVSEEALVPVFISAWGGGLRLDGLNITFETGAVPRPRTVPDIQVDTKTTAPRIIDLSRYFTDDITSSGNLTYRLDVKNQPPGVGLSLIFGHYLRIDARDAKFRGDIRAVVTASDAQGLSTQSDVHVKVQRAGEYVPPPPYYTTMAWVFGAVVLVLGVVALRLYLRSFRKRE